MLNYNIMNKPEKQEGEFQKESFEQGTKDKNLQQQVDLFTENTMYEEISEDETLEELEDLFKEDNRDSEDNLRNTQTSSDNKGLFLDEVKSTMERNQQDLYNMALKTWINLLQAGKQPQEAQMIINTLVKERQEKIMEDSLENFLRNHHIDPAPTMIKRLHALLKYNFEEAVSYANELIANNKISKSLEKSQVKVRELNKQALANKASAQNDGGSQKENIVRVSRQKWVRELAKRTGKTPVEQARFLVRNGYIK